MSVDAMFMLLWFSSAVVEIDDDPFCEQQTVGSARPLIGETRLGTHWRYRLLGTLEVGLAVSWRCLPQAPHHRGGRQRSGVQPHTLHCAAISFCQAVVTPARP